MTYAIDAYAGAAYALTEELDAGPTPGPFPAVPYPCPCGVKWKVYACQLATGRVRAILQPTAIDVQTLLNGAGGGTLTFPTRGVRARDIWPGLTSIYVTYDDEAVFPGYVEMFDASSTTGGGTVQVGVKSLEGYLYHRTLKSDVNPPNPQTLVFPNVSQTIIAASLVAQTVPNGIPLTPEAEASAYTRDRGYFGGERPFIGELIDDLTNSLNGPDWVTRSALTAGAWASIIRFQDRAGVDRDTIFKSDREGAEYGLSVDSANLATYVDGFGDVPGEDDPLMVNATDAADIYPEWDATPSFGTVSGETLQGNTTSADLEEQTAGYLRENREPSATPSFTLVGDETPIAGIRLGDTSPFHINQSAVTFHGRARVVGITYRGAVGEPLKRTLTLEPVERASASVLNSISTDECVVCR